MRPLGYALAVFIGLAGSHDAAAAVCGDDATQRDLNACADQDFRAADARLNDTYRQLVASLRDRPDMVVMLTKAERAWVSFRDAECAFAGSEFEGGTMQPMAISGCLAQVTTEREKMLRVDLSRPK